MAFSDNVLTSRQPKILLVDDREDNLLSIEAILEPDGYQFFRAYSGNQALKVLLNEVDFAMILMDVKMPILNGFETASLIYERDKLRHIPIIFITANNYGDENVFKGYQAGGIDYIFKPINPQVLRAKVSVFIELYKKNVLLLEQEQKLSVINMHLESELNILKTLEEKTRRVNAVLQKEVSDLQSVLTSSGLSMDRSEYIENDLNGLLKGLLADMEDLVREKMAHVSVEPLPLLRANPAMMRPLFQNLIRYALQQSHENGNPKIKIHSEIGGLEKFHNFTASDNKKYFNIILDYNGTGFDPMTADKSHHNGDPKAGKRLALCKKIVEEHDGFIATQSRSGGATLVISLPMAQ